MLVMVIMSLYCIVICGQMWLIEFWNGFDDVSVDLYSAFLNRSLSIFVFSDR